MVGDEPSRGQVGIGTLIVFIAMVLVAAMAAGALINTADVLEQTAADTADESQRQVTDRVMIASAMGNVTTNGSHVHNITMLVQAGPGSGTINLTKATIYADYGNTSTWLTVTDTDNNDCHALSDGDTCYLYIDSTFPPGEEISLKIVTAQGATTTFTTRIPDSLTNEGAVVLH